MKSLKDIIENLVQESFSIEDLSKELKIGKYDGVASIMTDFKGMEKIFKILKKKGYKEEPYDNSATIFSKGKTKILFNTNHNDDRVRIEMM